MKRRNRLIAMLLALVCIIPSAVMPAYAAETATETEAVTETAGYRLLTALDIIKDGENFSDDTAVTRGRFLSYAVRLYGHETILGTYENPFSDLTNANMYYNDIVTAYYIGIVSGSGGEVRPDDPITWAEAAKILTSILGYGAVCEASGGYPNGYVAKAGELRLFPRSVESAEYVKPSELVKVLLNTLESDICEVNTAWDENGNVSYEFETVKRRTLLSEVHEVYEGVGKINANQFTGMFGGDGAGRGKVFIDSVIYNVGTSGATDLLGHSVDYYYREVNDERVLVFVTPSKNDEAVTVAADDISARTTTTRFVYWDSETGKEEKIDILTTASMIWNGAQKTMTNELLRPSDGFVTLVDSNSDGEADVVLVTSYRTIRVSSVSDYDYTIADAFGGKAITADPTDSSCDVVIEKDGVAATFADIKRNDIISYAEAAGGKMTSKRLVISSKTLTGTVTETDDKSIAVDGVSYRVAGRVTPSEMTNKSGTFYLDYRGWIVDVDGSRAAVYGFLNKVGYKDGAIAHTLQAQIYTENDRWVELDFAEKVEYNGATMSCRDIQLPEKYQQLITYTVNSEGKINMLTYPETIAQKDFWQDTEMELIRNGVFRLSRDYESFVTGEYQRAYRSGNRSFNGYASLASDAKIFCVPDGGSDNKDDFTMRAVNALEGDKRYTGIKIYDMDENGVSKICVLDSSSFSGVVGIGGIKIVCGVGQTVTKEGERVPSLQVWMEDEKLSLPVKSQSVIDAAGGVKAGDVIQYSMDSKGRVSAINKRFDVQSDMGKQYYYYYNNAGTKVENQVYEKEVFAMGYIRNYADNSVRFDAGGNQFLFSTSNLGRVYIYDTAEKTLTKGTVNDLRDGIYGFAVLNYLKATDFIIFR